MTRFKGMEGEEGGREEVSFDRGGWVGGVLGLFWGEVGSFGMSEFWRRRWVSKGEEKVELGVDFSK